MSLSVGIVGLPNAGKSTLFNALLKKQIANIAAYPFTTIEPNVGVVEVPDEHLKALSRIVTDEKRRIGTEIKVVPAAVKFIDIAGLVKNAHKGEGLGNQFLAKIRECEAVVHVLRAFEDESVSHYYGSLDPKRDKEIVDIELELGGIKKPTLYVLNSSTPGEDIPPWLALASRPPRLRRVETGRSGPGETGRPLPECLMVNAKTGEGVDKLIQATYKLLGLITFYTIKGGEELRAWSLKKGESALEAAAKVHTDMAKGFIKAEVVSFDNLVESGGWVKARNSGKVRLEGREYQVKDGDVVEFKFSG